LPSSLFRSKSNTHFPSLLPRNNSTHNQKSQIHTPIMASFMPEQARAPPALPLPVPPVTKARFFDSFFDFHTPVIDFSFLFFFCLLCDLMRCAV
jgi:omega-amidase